MLIGKVKTNVSVEFDSKLMRQMLNQHYLGLPYCCEVNKEGNLVLKDHKQIKDLIRTQNNLPTNILLTISADLTDEGRLINFEIKKN